MRLPKRPLTGELDRNGERPLLAERRRFGASSSADPLLSLARSLKLRSERG